MNSRKSPGIFVVNKFMVLDSIWCFHCCNHLCQASIDFDVTCQVKSFCLNIHLDTFDDASQTILYVFVHMLDEVYHSSGMNTVPHWDET